MENSFRKAVKEEAPPRKGFNVFSFVERLTLLDSTFENGLPTQYIPKIMWVFIITLLYIGNALSVNGLVRKLNKTQTEVEELRVDYTTAKAEYMGSSKQSAIAEKVAHLGLKESQVPPRKIEIED